MPSKLRNLGRDSFAFASAREESAMNKVFRTGAAVVAALFGVLLFAGGSAGAGPISTTPGYWLAGADGGVFSFGAPFYGSGSTPVGPVHVLPPATEHARPVSPV